MLGYKPRLYDELAVKQTRYVILRCRSVSETGSDAKHARWKARAASQRDASRVTWKGCEIEGNCNTASVNAV